MKSITASICLQVSVHSAYLAWIKLDQFRAIITRLCGATRDRGARLVEKVPDQFLAWHDNEPASPRSSAEFEPLSDHRSRVTVFVNVESAGALPSVQEEVNLALIDFKARAERVAREQAVHDALGVRDFRR